MRKPELFRMQTREDTDDEDEETGLLQPLLPLSSRTVNSERPSFLGTPRIPSPPLCDLVRSGSPRPGFDFGDIVQFSAPVYFADEEEEYIEMEVIRLGTLNGTCSANYRTADGTAKQNNQYEASMGRVTFQDGEHTKSITIKILQDGKWTPSTEFRMNLKEPEGCSLGLFQFTARVKIVNEDAFPSSAYKELRTEGEAGMEKIDDWGLFMSYCKFNFETAGVHKSTIITLILDQMSNVALFVTLFVGVYMVDTIFARGNSTSHRLVVQGSGNTTIDRYHTAVLIAAWYVLPTTLLYAWDACKVRMDVKGTSRMFLQTCMMRTYMQYTSASRASVTPTDLNVVMAQSGEAVARSYVAAINIVRCIGKIIVVMLFIMVFQRDTFAMCAVALMPLLLLVFTLLNLGAFKAAQKTVDEKLRTLLMLSYDTCMKYRLLSEYFKRHVASSIFVTAAEEHTKASIPVNDSELRAVYITKFLSGCFIAVYIVVKAHDVLDNKLSLGVFLATIAIFGTYLSDAITELNEQLNVIIESFTSLQEFTLYFNLPSELSPLKEINVRRRQDTTNMRSQFHAGSFSSQSRDGNGQQAQEATDRIPLKTTNLTIRNHRGEEVLEKVNLEVDQGRLIAIIGQHQCGKSVFLQILADMILPKEGSVFVPSHLRVLHVSREPMFLRMSLTHNLTLGLPNEHKVNLDRVKAILSLLHMDELNQVIDDEMRLQAGRLKPRTDGLVDVGVAIEMADKSPKVIAWLEMLSHSTRVKLHIARALIANPNVMILQSPLQSFNEEIADQVLDLLRLHVGSRGLGYSDSDVQHRRPRTVLFIADTVAQASKADTVWECDKEKRTVIEKQYDPR